MSEKAHEVFAGIDVSKQHLEIAMRPSGERWSVRNDTEGIKELLGRLTGLEASLTVVEATGGLEDSVVSALAGEGLGVAVVNPRQVRNFARATGKIAKTDAIDAHVLAHFAEAVRPELRPLKDGEAREFSALVARRRQVLEMIVAEKNRLSRTSSKTICGEIREHIAWLERRLKDMDRGISAAVKGRPLWREKDNILRSVPGVGFVLSAVLLAEAPELGSLDRRKIASLVGVAPLNRDSGVYKGRRVVWGGRAEVRSVLYMSTLSAIRVNPVIREFYKRLLASGKRPKVALTACMRKLLTILNAMVQKKELWRSPELLTFQHSC